MSMFGRFDKDLKQADGCLHKAADMFFHPIGEDIFHKWDTNHPAFPGPKLTKVKVECKGKVEEKKVEEKKEEIKVVVKVEEKKKEEKVEVKVKVDEKCTHSHGHGHCGGHCHCHCHCHCCKPAPPPPPPPKPEPTCWRIYPCYKVIDKCAVVESEWCPTMKDYKADKLWQLHVYLPSAAKDKVNVDIIENSVVVHGEGVFHSHCGMWPEHVEHCCDCTRKEHVSFCKQFKLPDKMKLKEAHVEFEAEVLVVRIHRG